MSDLAAPNSIPGPRRRKRRFDAAHLALVAYVVLFVLFILAPLVVVVGSSFEPRELLRFPPQGLSLRWYYQALNSDLFVGAAWNSLIIAIFATLGALLLGVPAAYGLARFDFKGREAVSGLLNSPLLVPELVMGLALLQILAGLQIASSVLTLTLGHILICLPYVVRTINSAIVGVDRSVEEAAANLGAARWRIYLTILLPIIRPALYAAILFSFLMSFDNAVLSLFLVSARTSTLPISVYNYVQYSLDPAIAAVSTLLMAVSVVALFTVSRLVPLDRIKQ
ncbi:ABC transporter permease [Bosea caraganae]|uniref:ABC transporter permease n=1 Tax=Bosea caraganae TaxID=2763117 RepID=UPI0015F04451|nr:ABC transporter permease [Bosea caraganae]